jgi:hypothetical protein
MSQQNPLTPIRDEGDRQALFAEGLSSMEAVWKQIAEDGAGLFRRLPEPHRLRIIGDLVQVASQEALDEQASWWDRFWPDLLLGVMVLLFLSLGVRAFSRADSVAIALRDLRAGERLRSEDLHGAKGLDLPDGKQRGPALRLRTNIPAGSYLFNTDLERYEVIAVSRIPTGSVIPTNAVRQEWKPYRKGPAAQVEQVVGNRTTREILAGTTVRPDQVELEPVLLYQVVASQRIRRLHRITNGDIRLERRPRQPGALLKPAEAIGRYPMQELEAGSTLTSGILSALALRPDSLADRQLLTLRVQPPSFRLIPQLPARVNLAVAAAGGTRNLLLRNVIVLATESGNDGPAIVVALTEADLKQLVPLLSDTQIFVLQSSP